MTEKPNDNTGDAREPEAFDDLKIEITREDWKKWFEHEFLKAVLEDTWGFILFELPSDNHRLAISFDAVRKSRELADEIWWKLTRYALHVTSSEASARYQASKYIDDVLSMDEDELFDKVFTKINGEYVVKLGDLLKDEDEDEPETDK